MNDNGFSPLSGEDTSKTIASRTANDRVGLIPLRVYDAVAVESPHGMISVVAPTLSEHAPIFSAYLSNDECVASKCCRLRMKSGAKTKARQGNTSFRDKGDFVSISLTHKKRKKNSILSLECAEKGPPKMPRRSWLAERRTLKATRQKEAQKLQKTAESVSRVMLLEILSEDIMKRQKNAKNAF